MLQWCCPWNTKICPLLVLPNLLTHDWRVSISSSPCTNVVAFWAPCSHLTSNYTRQVHTRAILGETGWMRGLQSQWTPTLGSSIQHKEPCGMAGVIPHCGGSLCLHPNCNVAIQGYCSAPRKSPTSLDSGKNPKKRVCQHIYPPLLQAGEKDKADLDEKEKEKLRKQKIDRTWANWFPGFFMYVGIIARVQPWWWPYCDNM